MIKSSRIVAPHVKTIESLRNCALNNERAIADIVDNSFDANADTVIITIGKNDCITIFDNGKGMDLETMYEAVTLGSETGKGEGDLGKFGMGLKVSGTSMGRRLELLSKEAGKEPHKVIYDIEAMKDKEDWFSWEEELTKEEAKDFAGLNHGTYVRIMKLDNVKKQIEGCTVNYLRRAFRNFLADGKLMVVNGKTLTPIDPLSRDLVGKGTKIYFDKTVKLSGKDVHFTVAEVDADRSDIGARTGDDNHLGVTLASQGFFVVRNGREIKGPDLLDIFERHPHANRFRCEISFNDDADKEFGVPPTKDNVTLSDAMKAAIKRLIGPYRLAIFNSSKRTQQTESVKDIDHSDAERIIAEKIKFLHIKKAFKEMRSRRKHKDVIPKTEEQKKKDEKKKRVRKNFKKIQPSAHSMPAEFQEAPLGEYGPLFDCYQDKGKIVIRWNYEHPFHEKVVAKYNKDKNITTPIDLLVYACANEILSVGEATLSDGTKLTDVIECMVGDMSDNLRIEMEE